MKQRLPLLPMRTLHTNKFCIEIQKPLTLLDMAKQILNQEEVDLYCKKFKKQIHTWIFAFRIKHEDKDWILYKKIQQFEQFQDQMRKKFGREIPALPIKKSKEVKSLNVAELSEFLLIFLNKIVNVAFYDDQVQDFLDIMPIEIGRNPILCEVPLYKRSGGRFNEAAITKQVKRYLCCCCRNWRRRYFTVTDHGVFYCQNKKSFNIKQMLPYSSYFKVSHGMNNTGDYLGVRINSDYRTLELSAGNFYEFILFLKCINTALLECPYKQSQRYQSFSGIRQNCFSTAYVDGQDYFTSLCHELLSARKHVYITDWMMTPYFLLRRPTQLDDRSSRLDYVLESIASRGVKVYIILYMQPQIVLNNDSEFVEKYLTQLNPNIKVLRHPNYLLIPFLWSHHQKLVSIDQRVAFMGGLDICYGRWDNSKHYLTEQKGQSYWKGAQFCNLRISDIYHPRNFLISNLDAKTQPRLPWHDIGISLKGGSVIDLQRHFVQYWNFVSFQTKFDDRQLLLHAGRHSIAPQKFDFKRILPNRIRQKFEQDTHHETKRNMHEQQEQSMNDDQLSFYREHLSHNFSAKDNIISMFQDLPNLKNIKNYPKKLINYLKEGEYQIDAGNRLILTEEIKQKAGTQTHQILRSASTWSMGLDQNHLQASIHQAYLDLIRNAKQFIYIENQFFVCKQNNIVRALVQRIKRAYEQKQRFKVMIMIPLLPAFQGHVDTDSAVIMKAQLHWQYKTINRSRNSLFQQLSDVPNLSDYLNFYSLRNHGVTKIGKPVTQMIYIHSKLMIVDDTKVILGSANINDRSMLGDRDSQLAVLIEGGQTFKVNLEHVDSSQQVTYRYVTKFAHELRVKLFIEHTGLTRQQVDDFLSNLLWKKIAQRARNNTMLYRQIFGCYPDDTILKFVDLQKLTLNARIQNYSKYCKQIKGHIVEFPLKFLERENIGIAVNTKEYFLLPEINFL